jgi:CRP-like cAMP-binding protein
MWALTDDLEYAATRRAEEHLVADAAAWALAGRANGAAIPHDTAGHPLPIVELADRLRSIPLFDFVSVDEVFRIAATGVQVRYQTGHTVYQEGAVAEHVQFLTDGVVRLTGSGPTSDVSSPAALAFEDMLEGRPVRHTMTATAPAVSLSLSGAALLTMMSDNIVLARGFFRMLVGSDPNRPLKAVVHLPPDGKLVTAWRPPLEPVEKAGLLRQTPILGRASVDQLLDLVTVAREIPLAAGTVLFKDTDPPSVFHVLEGEVVLERAGAESVTVGPGGMIGMADTLAGLPLRCTARVTKSGHALRIDQDPLFEVLADHGELLQGLFSGVLRASLGKSQ